MPILTEKDFEKIAKEVVDGYTTGKTKLAEGAAEMAMQHNMNPNQVNEMSRAINVETFLRMLEQAKQNRTGDMTQEFDPVDSNAIIQQMLMNAGSMPQEQEVGGELPMTEDLSGLSDVPQGTEDKLPGGIADNEPDEAFNEEELAEGQKDEAEEHTDDPDVAKEIAKDHLKKDPKYYKKQKKNKKEAEILNKRKLASTLSLERKGLEYSFEEKLSKLAFDFKKLYAPSFYLFEKDAMALYGNISLPIINSLREKLGMPLRDFLDSGKVKIATINGILEQERIVESSPYLDKFEALVSIVKEAIELDDTLEKLK